MRIILDSHQEMDLPPSSTAFDLAKILQLTGPDQALAVRIHNSLKDLTTPLHEGDLVSFIDFSSPEGKEIFWHTSAHVLGQAVLRLWPQAKLTIGPPIDAGFYYDFANLQISDADFLRIEEEMKKIIAENHKPKRHTFATKKEALEAFKHNPFKVEIIQNLPEGEPITAYEQGEFFDLCRGPHLFALGKIKALKVLKTSGAYWKGQSENEMLTRIYAITFPQKNLLDEYLHQIEEAKKRDHKILGPKLDLFMLREEAPGLPFILPHGMHVWNSLLAFWRELHQEAGYIEIKTPQLMTRELWERSGHWANYRHNMYTCQIENRDFAIKPMNCPGCMIFYKSSTRSYRDLPLKVAEMGLVHRYEASGALSGLFRVRGFHQDDAHIFMQPQDIEEEILKVLELAKTIYHLFDLQYRLELSTRPLEGTIGSDKDWEQATLGLQKALERAQVPYRINPGDGAFYGPKIDLHIQDALKRTWQCGTIQLDMALPERFELEYVAKDGSHQRPVMIHRALFGSLERFFGILIEHFAGRFPLWLSPRQIRILPVADRHVELADSLHKRLSSLGFISSVDDSHESIAKKVRNAQIDQVNYMITLGDKELQNNAISLRTRDNVHFDDLKLDSFIDLIKKEKMSRSLTSPFRKDHV